jgi:hypothetical protein
MFLTTDRADTTDQKNREMVEDDAEGVRMLAAKEPIVHGRDGIPRKEQGSKTNA